MLVRHILRVRLVVLIIAINIEVNTNIHNSGLIDTIEDNCNDLDK